MLAERRVVLRLSGLRRGAETRRCARALSLRVAGYLVNPFVEKVRPGRGANLVRAFPLNRSSQSTCATSSVVPHAASLYAVARSPAVYFVSRYLQNSPVLSPLRGMRFSSQRHLQLLDLLT